MPHLATSACVALALLLLHGCGTGGHNGIGPAPDTYDVATEKDAATKKDTGPDVTPQDTAGKDTGAPDAGGGPLSCKGKCMDDFKPGQPCQCNDQCTKYGNCCADWGALCKPELNSCVGRCGQSAGKDLPCNCQWNCGKTGSCCADYLDVCQKDVYLDWVKATDKECGLQGSWYGVKQIKDGDTIVLTNGDIVRFLIVNTPEIKSADCYAQDASSFTYKTLKKAGIVCLVKDPGQPDKDQYDRLLRYVYYKDPAANGDAVQMNARLVRLGYGTVFYPYAKGNVHEQISVLMQQKARLGKLGGWGSCGWK